MKNKNDWTKITWLIEEMRKYCEQVNRGGIVKLPKHKIITQTLQANTALMIYLCTKEEWQFLLAWLKNSLGQNSEKKKEKKIITQRLQQRSTQISYDEYKFGKLLYNSFCDEIIT